MPAPPPPPWGTPQTGQVPPPGYYPPPGQSPPGGSYPPGSYPAPPPVYWGPPPAALSPQQERTWAMFAHIGAIIAGFVLGGMGFVGPLIVMLTSGTKSAFVRRHAVESLNFQLTLIIASIAGVAVSVVLLIVTLGLGLLVLIPLLIVGAVVALIFTVIGGVAANNGEDYRYPINIRMVK